MSDLSKLLREFADRVASGRQLKGAAQCAIVLGTEDGTVQATYIGRGIPRENAGVLLLAQGIQMWNNDMAKDRNDAMARSLTSARGST